MIHRVFITFCFSMAVLAFGTLIIAVATGRPIKAAFDLVLSMFWTAMAVWNVLGYKKGQ